jgi:endoglucanase
MRSALLALAFTMLTAGAAAGEEPTPSQQACEAATKATVPQSRLAALARGFNLPGWLEGSNSHRPDPAVLARLHTRGFTHIRLPIGAERLMEEFSARNDVARTLAELDFAIDTLTRLGYVVSIDMHPGDRLGRLERTEPQRAFGLLGSLWRQLSHRYAARSPERLFFEVLNEPTVDWATWNEQGPRLAAAIRREAPLHTIIYGHPDYQRIDALANVTPLPDANVVYAAHFYDPMIFTHQGLDWSDDPLRYLRKVPFPARLTDPPVVRLVNELTRQGRDASVALVKTWLQEPWTEARVDNEIARAAAWTTRNQRPVIINEFGVLAWQADPLDRARWLRTVRSAAERACIGWTHWDYADGFGFVQRVADREIPDEAIVRALLDGKPPAVESPKRALR